MSRLGDLPCPPWTWFPLYRHRAETLLFEVLSKVKAGLASTLARVLRSIISTILGISPRLSASSASRSRF